MKNCKLDSNRVCTINRKYNVYYYFMNASGLVSPTYKHENIKIDYEP